MPKYFFSREKVHKSQIIDFILSWCQNKNRAQSYKHFRRLCRCLSPLIWKTIRQFHQHNTYKFFKRTSFCQLFYVHVTREKLPKWRLYEKCARITLLKLTPRCLNRRLKVFLDWPPFYSNYFSPPSCLSTNSTQQCTTFSQRLRYSHLMHEER